MLSDYKSLYSETSGLQIHRSRVFNQLYDILSDRYYGNDNYQTKSVK